LAHLAVIARHGAGWFRELGTEHDPGSALVTVSGAVAAPGVYEIEHGMPLSELLEVAQLSDRLGAVLVGGYFGTWLSGELVPEVRLSGEHLSEYGAALGAGVIVALGAEACPVAETTRIADWFAAESAGQCGPCVNGLDAIAATVHQLATGAASRTAWSDLERWVRDMHRRGACQHPDGAVRFITSALRVFALELRDHARRGPCERCAGPSVLPAPIHARHQG
jgi:NADH:ubiquinone oxidoreductase subunit F (NADH-binding)